MLERDLPPVHYGVREDETDEYHDDNSRAACGQRDCMPEDLTRDLSLVSCGRCHRTKVYNRAFGLRYHLRVNDPGWGGYRTACGRGSRSSTNLQTVTCERCRRTKAWKEATSEG